MTNRKIFFAFLPIIAFIGTISTQNISVSAADNPGEFSVKAIIPDNQVDKDVSYFDLLVTPNQEETLEFEVQNLADKDRTFDININPALTSDGGTIDYTQRNAKLDKSIPFDVRNHFKLDNSELTVKAKSTVRVPIKMQLPDKIFKGRVLAGINVTPKEVDENTDSGLVKSDNGTKIVNRLAYTLAIVLQQKTDKVEPKLELTSAGAKAYNSKPYINFNLQNPSGTILNNLVFSTKVYRNGQIYIKNTSNPYLVAPNSNFNLRLDLDGHTLESGKYSTVIVAKTKDHSWKFKKTFNITDKQANDVNKNTVYDTNNSRWWIWLVVVLVVAILGITGFFFIRHRKSQG